MVITGAPLNLPNGIAFDAKGNLVVVNIGTTTSNVHARRQAGDTEQAVDPATTASS